MLKILYQTILDALFPLSPAEKEIFSLSPREALEKLPPAPNYSGLAVDLPDTRSIFAYKDERVSKLIWNIKYKHSTQAVEIGGYALFSDLEEISTDAASGVCPILVLPMPITSRRRRERGYNQCELLMDEIARWAQERDPARFVFDRNLLIRTHHADRQTMKDRKHRVEDAKGIFAIDEKTLEKLTEAEPELTKRRLIVIDDVITTGSTMHEAIETLKRAGFTDVRGLSLAH